MRHSLFTFVVVGLFALLLGSCKPFTSPPSTTTYSTPYFPLAVGNMWRYSISGRASDSSTLVRRCIAERDSIGFNEFDMLDSTRLNGTITVYLQTLRQRDNVVESVSEGWLINFQARTRDQSDVHGYVQNTLDSVRVIAGTFHDVVGINYPASDYDGMPYQQYVRNIGMVTSAQEGPYMELIGAIIDSKKYGNP